MRTTFGGTGWQGDLLDLDAYLNRVGYEGDRSPTLASLRGLHLATRPVAGLSQA